MCVRTCLRVCARVCMYGGGGGGGGRIRMSVYPEEKSDCM